MKKTPLFAIILVVLSLGCSASDSPVGPGLMVKEFKFTPNYLNGDQITALTLVVQNKGSKNIDGAYATVYGFGEATMWTVTGDMTTQRFDLRAPSSFTNNVGEEKRFVWLMKNNDIIPKDAVRPYTANARVCYPYETSVLARTEIISENEWMSNPPTQHQIDVKQTTGPVRITILSKQPVIMSSRVSLELLIENVGSGTVTMPEYCDQLYGGASIDSDKLNRINMIIEGISDDCEIDDEETLFLEQGRQQKITVSCAVSGIDAPITTADISIGLEYDYYLDARASVRVVGPVNADGVEDEELEIPTIEACGDESDIATAINYESTENSIQCLIDKLGDPTTSCTIDMDTVCDETWNINVLSKEDSTTDYVSTGISIKYPDKKILYPGGEKDFTESENIIAYVMCDATEYTAYFSIIDECASTIRSFTLKSDIR